MNLTMTTPSPALPVTQQRTSPPRSTVTGFRLPWPTPGYPPPGGVTPASGSFGPLGRGTEASRRFQLLPRPRPTSWRTGPMPAPPSPRSRMARAALAAIHRDSGHTDPTDNEGVRRVMAGLSRTIAKPQKQAAALTVTSKWPSRPLLHFLVVIPGTGVNGGAAVTSHKAFSLG